MMAQLLKGSTASLLAVFLSGCSPQSRVPTPKKPVTHEYHGVKVGDDYEWLEKADDPAVRHFYAVDLPGYGYAKVSKTVRAGWKPMIEQYLTGSDGLRGVLLLVDSRRTERQDAEAVDWLLLGGLPVLLVATKSDKLSRSERAGGLAALRGAFGLPEEADVVAYSSVTHEGRDELWQAIRTMLTASSG